MQDVTRTAEPSGVNASLTASSVRVGVRCCSASRCFEDDTCFAECGVNFRSVSATRNPLLLGPVCRTRRRSARATSTRTACGLAEGTVGRAEHPCGDLCWCPARALVQAPLINGCGCPAGSAVASEIGLSLGALLPRRQGGVPRQQQVTTQTPAFDIHRGSRGRHAGRPVLEHYVHSTTWTATTAATAPSTRCARAARLQDCGSRLAGEEEPAALAPGALVGQQHARRRTGGRRALSRRRCRHSGALAAAAVALRRRRAASAASRLVRAGGGGADAVSELCGVSMRRSATTAPTA